MTQSTWSDAEKERLTALWASGLSCGKIGEAMRRSKNAVVSAIHRLELPPRPSPIRFGKPALTIEERREHAAASQRKANLRRRNLTLSPLPSEAVAPVHAIARPVASAEPPLRPHRSASGRGGSSIMFRGLATLPAGTVEHVEGRCSWPLTCGSPCDGRYCTEHSGLLKQRRAA